MTNVSSQVFTAATAYGVQPTAVTVVIPKGAKAVITSLSLSGHGVLAATAFTTTVVASGGQTGTLIDHRIPIAGSCSATTIGNGSFPISGTIDASTAAVTLTLTADAGANAGDFVGATLTGEYIS